MSVTGGIKDKYPDTELHWIVRKDLASLLKIDPRIDKLWEFDRNDGVSGLIKTAFELKKEKFDLIYDAHSNIRSNILKLVLCPFTLCNIFRRRLITRHKSRLKRFLLFNFRINLLPKPFRAFESFRKPLNRAGVINFNIPYDGWVFPDETEKKIHKLLLSRVPEGKKWITLVPSAAWELKRWPVEYWKKLVELLPDYYFAVLGGPADTFCEDIRDTARDRVINLAGKTSLMESFCVVSHSPYVISGDTGFLHAADLFDKPGQAIIGPTAFGFPSGERMRIVEVDLPCRPCTKDGSTECKLKEKRKCLMDITPEIVAGNVKKDY
jgi:heptosyltransferase-2